MITLFVSDIHAGSHMSNLIGLIPYLLSTKCDSLVIVGDGQQHNSQDKDVQTFYNLLNHLSEKIEVIYLMGNHDDDTGLDELGFKEWERAMLYKLPKVRFAYTLNLKRHNRNILVLHGHQYTGDDSTFTRTAVKAFGFVQKLLGKKFVSLYRAIDHTERILLNAAKKVREKAIAHGIIGGYDTVICGHSHTPEMTETGGVLYCNTGHCLGKDSWILQFEDDKYPILYNVPNLIEAVNNNKLFVEQTKL